MMPRGSHWPHSMRVVRVLVSMNRTTEDGRQTTDQVRAKERIKRTSKKSPVFICPPSSVRCSLRRHAQRVVKLDGFPVEIAVLDHVACQCGVLRRIAELLRERQRGGEALARRLGQPLQHWRVEDAGRDSVDA